MNSKTINVLVSAETASRLQIISRELGRSVEELAECAVAEEALRYFRHRKDDPAKGGEA